MRLFNDDLNKTAVAMGKVIKLLDDVQSKISWNYDLLEHKEDFYGIAYICRVGILDRIEKNNWLMTSQISIPSGIVKFKRETIATGLMKTVVRLKDMVKDNVSLENEVNGILDRTRLFHEYVNFLSNILSEEQMKQFNKSI